MVCYTNHALDQFLEDLLHIGIEGQNIVRLGGRHNVKSTVGHLSVYNVAKDKYVRSKAQWTLVDAAKEQANYFNERLHASFNDFLSAKVDTNTLLSYIEFEDPDYFEAFRVPERSDGMTIIGPKRTVVDSRFLVSRWVQGQDAWRFRQEPHVRSAAHIWNMDPALRSEKLEKWRLSIMEEIVEAICVAGKGFNSSQDDITRMFKESDIALLKSKRIIGCTTTGAAKFTEALKVVSPDVLLVEEAGEILESHVITALGPSTKQMILIGDHQ